MKMKNKVQRTGSRAWSCLVVPSRPWSCLAMKKKHFNEEHGKGEPNMAAVADRRYMGVALCGLGGPRSFRAGWTRSFPLARPAAGLRPGNRDEWSSHSCKVYSHCFDVSLSRLANLSPVGSFAPAQSASRPSSRRAGTNPFRHFPSGSNSKRLKSKLVVPSRAESPLVALGRPWSCRKTPKVEGRGGGGRGGMGKDAAARASLPSDGEPQIRNEFFGLFNLF